MTLGLLGSGLLTGPSRDLWDQNEGYGFVGFELCVAAPAGLDLIDAESGHLSACLARFRTIEQVMACSIDGNRCE